MTDQEKLFHYAKTFSPDNFHIFTCENHMNSYFYNCEDNDINDYDIMEYNIEHYSHLKKYLTNMWSKTGFKNPDLLSTIVSATAMKNIPAKIESNLLDKDLEGKPIRKEAHEHINANDAPPAFVYEF